MAPEPRVPAVPVRALARRRASAAVLAQPRALAVPVRELLVLAHRPGSEAALVLLPEVPRARAGPAAVEPLPSRLSSSAALMRRSNSEATGPR